MKTSRKQVNEESSTETSLKEQFDQVKNQPTTRKVKLVYKSCCGCGCTDIDIERTVPINSELQDGDRTEEVEDDDVMID